MNFLSLFVLIPVLMTCAMFCTSNARTVRTVMMTGASMLLALAVGVGAQEITSSTGSGNNSLYAAIACASSKFMYHIRSTVCRSNYHLYLYSKFFQSFFCRLKNRPVRITSHNNSNFHLSLLFRIIL